MRSDNVTKGSERAPNRSLFYALGYTPEELDRPLIGVVSAYSEIVPGHMNLDKIADAVKAGVPVSYTHLRPRVPPVCTAACTSTSIRP